MVSIPSERELYHASSQELTSLLYQAGAEKLEQAVHAIEHRQYMPANRLLQRSNDILYRLGAGLNYEAGVIADHLAAIYNYMAEKLVIANLKKDPALVREVLGLWQILADGWEQARQKGTDNQSPVLKRKIAAYDQDPGFYPSGVDRHE
ncbi:MAG: flagellar export chaperone FliS [Heliobacteriaceae bacterium]|nr:flagellar export chaperone FliS [Heliobacteriaceae bacterium]MDD4588507.1 flagellar export chaperone FliS [Heliobacteriaceae bacterium]